MAATSVAQAGFIFSPCYFLTLIILVPGGQKFFLILKGSQPTCQIFSVLFYLIALLSSPKSYIKLYFSHRTGFPHQLAKVVFTVLSLKPFQKAHCIFFFPPNRKNKDKSQLRDHLVKKTEASGLDPGLKIPM